MLLTGAMLTLWEIVTDQHSLSSVVVSGGSFSCHFYGVTTRLTFFHIFLLLFSDVGHHLGMYGGRSLELAGRPKHL